MHWFVDAFGFFFHWIGISHYLNLLLVGFMVRSGLEILSAHPKLYWRDDCRPGSEWLGYVIEPVRRVLLHHVASHQSYSKDDVSPFFRVNG